MLNANTPLFMILPLERFLQMLKNKQNTLVQPSSWDDPFEKMINKSAIIRGDLLNYFDNEKKTEVKFNSNNWYGQCWSKSEESDALWRVFTKNKAQRCVKIESSYGLLNRSLDEYKEYCNKKSSAPKAKMFIDEIQYAKSITDDYAEKLDKLIKKYRKETETLEQCFALSMLLIKRKAFSHEEEIRILAHVDSRERYKLMDKTVFPYFFNPGDMIVKVELDPWTPAGTEQIIADAINNSNEYLKLKIEKSHLYEDIPETGGIQFEVTKGLNERFSLEGPALENRPSLALMGRRPKDNKKVKVNIGDK